MLLGATTDHMAELGYWERRRRHNLKYSTWGEQQGRTPAALDALRDRAWWRPSSRKCPPSTA